MSTGRYENPFIVQSDHPVLVEVDSPRYVEGRDALARFAELVKSPEHIHTYRITPLSIWNACAAGVAVEWIREQLRGLSKYDVPRHVEIEIAEYAARYGKLKLTRDHRGLVLSISAAVLAEELVRHQTVAFLLGQRIGSQEFLVEPVERGRLKQALIRVGYPVEDLAGYREGEQLEIILRRETRAGLSFHLRDYQREAAETFSTGAELPRSLQPDPIHQDARYLRIIVGNLKVGRKQLQLLGFALLVKDLDAFQPPGLRRAAQLPQVAQRFLARSVDRSHGLHQGPVGVLLTVLVALMRPQKHLRRVCHPRLWLSRG
jgi:hypothetical protein